MIYIYRNVLSPKNFNNYDNVWFVLEYGGNDLLHMEKNSTNLNWKEKNVKYIIYQILCGLKYLHVYLFIYLAI